MRALLISLYFAISLLLLPALAVQAGVGGGTAVSTNSGGGEDRAKAEALTAEAIQLMRDNSSATKQQQAIDLLRRADQLWPDNPLVKYELSYAYYLTKDYKRSEKLLNELVKQQEAKPLYYSLLSAVKEANGDRKGALKSLKKGIKKFPSAGRLHTDLGGLALGAGDVPEAVGYWEEGISNAPEHSSNYYWAAQQYHKSEERVWSVLYTELFLHLEPMSDRGQAMSKLLFDTYTGVGFTDEGEIKLSLSKQGRVTLAEDTEDDRSAEKGINFETAVEMVLHNSCSALSTPPTVEELVKTLVDFQANWSSYENLRVFENPLFEAHACLQEEGLLEAYYRWLFKEADTALFNNWKAANPATYRGLMEWMRDNSIRLSANTAMYRDRYTSIRAK